MKEVLLLCIVLLCKRVAVCFESRTASTGSTSRLAWSTATKRRPRLGVASYHPASALFAFNEETASQADSGVDENSVNGSGGFAGGLMSMADSAKSQLASAFSALDESDQYDAVLTGLCAKILDNPSNPSSEQIKVALQDPISLLGEMNQRRIPASGRSLSALVDATVSAQDASVLSQILSLAIKNGGISRFGFLKADVTPLPSNPSSRVRLPGGATTTREDRLSDSPDVPSDDRNNEIASALAVAGVVGFCGTINVLGINELSPFTSFIWFWLIVIGLVDNFYDIIKFGTQSFAKDIRSKLPDELPLSLGSGSISGSVVRGFGRLLQVDTERECECEAAAFFAAYALGLPTFAFRPNSLEAAVLIAESSQPGNNMDNLLSSNGILRMLVWLMAPVAMENSKHAVLIFSDPREAEGLLKRLENSDLIKKDELWWMGENEQERLDLLKWAFLEADLLIRNNRSNIAEISKRLTGGAATVGDCVAAMEDW